MNRPLDGPETMTTRVCVGGGALGTRAALQGRANNERTLVIDIDVNCQAGSIADIVLDVPDEVLAVEPGTVALLIGDGSRVLDSIFDGWVPDLVVPASQGHLAARLAVEHVRKRGKHLVPSPDRMVTVMSALPDNNIFMSDRKNAVVVTSYMPSSLVCEEGCPQPSTCPVTGRTFPRPMYVLIAEALQGRVDRSFVLRTLDAGGVGAVKGTELLAMLSRLERMSLDETCGIATACNCHGLLNLMVLTGE